MKPFPTNHVLIRSTVFIVIFTLGSVIEVASARDLNEQQIALFKSEWQKKFLSFAASDKPISATLQQQFVTPISKLSSEQIVHFSYTPFAYLLTDPKAIKSVLQTAAKDSRIKQNPTCRGWEPTSKDSNLIASQEIDALNHLVVQVAQDDLRLLVMKCFDKQKPTKDPKQRTETIDKLVQVVTVFSNKVLRDRSLDRACFLSKLLDSLSKEKPALVIAQIEQISAQNVNDPNLNWDPKLRSLAAKLYDPSLNDIPPRKIPLTGQFATSRERDDGMSEAGWLKHFPDISTGQYGIGKEQLKDLMQFQKMLISKSQVINNLQALDSRVQAIRNENTNITPADALNRALMEKEAEHGFSTAKIIPLGVLPSKLFLTLPAQGYVVQDIGASLDHGEFTHRLQWRAMIESFDQERKESKLSWAHTPYELFTLIGQRDLDAATADSDEPEWNRGNSIWVHLMDKLGINDIGGFRHADGMQQYFLDQDRKRTSNQPTELQFIAEGVRERFQVQLDGVLKYQKQMADFRAAPAAQQKAIASILPIDLTGSPNTVAFDLFMNEYRIMRTADGSYKLWDPGQPDLPLLIGSTDKKVSPETVELSRLESREKFGLLSSKQSDRLAELRKRKQ